MMEVWEEEEEERDSYHDIVGEFLREGADEIDEGGVVGDEALDAEELVPAVGDGFLHPPRRLLRLIGWEEGFEGGDRSPHGGAHRDEQNPEESRE